MWAKRKGIGKRSFLINRERKTAALYIFLAPPPNLSTTIDLQPFRQMSNAMRLKCGLPTNWYWLLPTTSFALGGLGCSVNFLRQISHICGISARWLAIAGFTPLGYHVVIFHELQNWSGDDNSRLIGIQRFFSLNVATQRCRWRDSW